MNLEQLDELVQAAKAGKMLQMHWNDKRGWVDVLPDQFMCNFQAFPNHDWRIKPELREWWVNDYGDSVWKCWYPSRDAADILASFGRKRLIHLKEIEVIEFP